MRGNRTTIVAFVLFMAALATVISKTVTATGVDTQAARQARIERGAQLVRTMGCNDCHTPWQMGPRGPEPDMTRALTGHPSDLVMPAPPKLPPGPWIGVTAATNTAWAGPWGVSFTANLTPDRDNGLGQWTEDMFIQTMRTGRHEGKGRPLLPPMPYWMIGALGDDDIKALFAYLQSLPPSTNKVPQPIDPPEGQ